MVNTEADVIIQETIQKAIDEERTRESKVAFKIDAEQQMLDQLMFQVMMEEMMKGYELEEKEIIEHKDKELVEFNEIKQQIKSFEDDEFQFRKELNSRLKQEKIKIENNNYYGPDESAQQNIAIGGGIPTTVTNKRYQYEPASNSQEQLSLPSSMGKLGPMRQKGINDSIATYIGS